MINKSEKYLLSEALRQLADDLDEIVDNKSSKLKWISVELVEISDKLECWHTGKDYINPVG